MPRGKRRTTQSGAPAQAIRSVPGQRYGEGVEQQQLQRAMPAPDMQEASAPNGMAGGPPVIPSPAPDPAMIQQYLAGHNPNMLGGTQMPDQPVTAGLSTGPGPGPSALARPRTPTARWLHRLGQETGNPKWKRLAEEAGL